MNRVISRRKALVVPPVAPPQKSRAPRLPAAQPRVEPLEPRQLLSAGGVDSSFGTSGQIVDSALPAVAHMAIQRDGKIVVVGSNIGQTVTVTRYNADGTIDNNFGTGGSVTTDFGVNGAARDIIIESNRTIVVVGTSNGDIALAAYNSNGTVDSGFAGSGFSTTAISGTADADFIAVNRSGQLLVAGNDSATGIFAARFSSTGALDTSFGTAGITTTSTGIDTFNDAALQRNGSLDLVGKSTTGTDHYLILRLDASGNPDGHLFGNHNPSGANVWGAAAVDSNDNLLVAGSDNGIGVIARYTSKGYVDRSFGTSGQTFFDPGTGNTAEFIHLFVQPNGKILAVGEENVGGSNVSLLARFLANGQIDASFGTAGIVTTDFGTSDQQFNDVKLLQDGAIVAAGGSPIIDHENIAAFTNDIDVTPPTATLASIGTVRRNTATLTFNVVYQDNQLIDPSTLGNSNIVVTGPGGFRKLATLTTVGRQRSGGPLSVLYTITGPFTSSTDGTYTVSIQRDQVADLSGNFVSAAALGSFTVTI